MSFSISTLKNDLYSAFKKMKSDDDFADKLSKAVKDFGESGDIVTIDTGTVSSGVFAGAGKGSISLVDSLCSAPIKVACKTMRSLINGGDEILANAIGNGIQAMVTAGQVNTNVTGVTTSPQGSPVPPSSGSAKGTLTCQNVSLISGLISVFKDMKDRYAEEDFDGNDYFADEFSKEINSYFIAGIVATNGTGALDGTTGSGSIS